jgi:N-acetylglucosaminyldiphosphoundecaprenol N-acetyl-beta-D-mannosaminyltransferase
LGCPVDALSLEETVAESRRLIAERSGAIQVSINVLKINLAHDNERFRTLLGSFEIASADGVPVVWASRLLRRPLPGRVNGTDLMFELIEMAEREGLSVYVLGARDEVLSAATARLRELHPRLRIAGTHHGYFSAEEERAVVAEVAQTRPDIVFVALPSPRKEEFLVEYSEALGAGFAMGVGGSIDVLAGIHPRAPIWMQRSGLEWFFRVVRDPRGMSWRYLRTNTRFLGFLAVATMGQLRRMRKT